MRKEVTKVIKVNNPDGSDPILVLHIDHENHTVDILKSSGCDPTMDNIFDICHADRDIFAELMWAAKEYRRKDDVYINEREGYSGCRDITLYTSHAPEWARAWMSRSIMTPRCKLHISMYGKVEGVKDVFAGDLFDILGYYCSGTDGIFGDYYKMIEECINGEPHFVSTKIKYLKFHNFKTEKFTSYCGSFMRLDLERNPNEHYRIPRRR